MRENYLGVMLMKKQPDQNGRDPLSYAVLPTDGVPDDVTALVNKYGTYEVQDTAATENPMPAIAQGLPKAWKKKKIPKEEIGKTE